LICFNSFIISYPKTNSIFTTNFRTIIRRLFIDYSSIIRRLFVNWLDSFQIRNYRIFSKYVAERNLEDFTIGLILKIQVNSSEFEFRGYLSSKFWNEII
jgi:hypothetical protein